MTSTKVRFGVLGAARIAPPALIRPAADNPEATVEVVGARDLERATAYARRHRIPRVADSYQAVVEDPDIDAVDVPLPEQPPRRIGWWPPWRPGSTSCARNPSLQRSRGGGGRCIAASAAAADGLVVLEAFHYRYHPLARRMREIVESGELGRLRHIETWLCAPIVNKSDIRYQFDLAGGAMMDMGCYVVNMARMLGGEEPSVISATAKLHDPDIDRAMSAELRFPSGHTASVHCSMWSSSLLHVAARVSGDNGELRVFNPIGPQYLSWLTVRSGGSRRTEIPSRRPTYAYQLDAFCNAVLRGQPAATTPEDAVANMTVIDDVYRAANMHPRGS